MSGVLKTLDPCLAYTVEFWFFEPPRETKIGSKNLIVWEIEGKITVFDWGEGNDFWFELLGGSKKWGFEKSGFQCTINSIMK